LEKAAVIDRMKGVFVPMFTPFTGDGNAIDEAQLRRNVQFLIQSGIRILNPAGTTGEFWTLTPDEHRRVVEIVIGEAASIDPEVVVCAGVSHTHVRQTTEMARFAVGCGAPILQITPPFYLPSCDGDVVAYYRHLSQVVGAPIMAYENVLGTGVQLRGELLGRICEECPQVVAVKTAALADAPREFERLVRRFGRLLRIFSATGTYYSPFAYMTGVVGITDTLANVAPAFGLELHRLAGEQRWDKMNQLYQDAFDVLEIELLYGRAGLKQIGNLCGVTNGLSRFPMTSSLSEMDIQDIRNRLARWSFTRSSSRIN
jgi:4-hydroxy-tetrahydrodipicolinate synthase